MRFTLSQISAARSIQPPALSALIGTVWQPLAAISAALAVGYTQIMFLRAMVERF